MTDKRVLIVDDEDNIVLHLGRALKARGWEVLTASTLLEAKSAFSAYAPGTVITDIQLTTMGRREGLHLLKEFKATRPSTRVIVMTGFGSADAEREALDGGAECYYEKPFVLKGLFDRLDGQAPGEPSPTGALP
jgi:two-component system, NtrC family, response regulator AtoC